MVIAEVLPDGQIEVIERLQRATRLGQDAFRRGRLGAASMRVALAILRDFHELLKLYKVEQVRAVATSAAREASNSDTFLDRIYLATGLKVEVIGTPEESRLTVSAVRQALGNSPCARRGETLIANVGGGSTLLTLLRDGEIVTSQGLRLGSVRLHEVLASNEDSPEQTAKVFRYQVSSMLAALQNSMSLEKVESFIAVGGNARFAVRQIGHTTDSPELFRLDPREFDDLVAQLRALDYRGLGQAIRRSLCRGRDRQSGVLGLPEPVPPDEGPANHRIERDDARRAAAGACQPGHGERRPGVGVRRDPLGNGDRTKISRRSWACRNGGRRGPAAVR